MPGTVKGGRKAAETNKRKYGSEFYKRIGALGGKKSTGGGFAANPELARIAGKIGGRARGKKGSSKDYYANVKFRNVSEKTRAKQREQARRATRIVATP